MSEVLNVVERCLSHGDEPEWFEYKQGTAVSKPDEIGEYISALSNAAALSGEPFGYIIWGVNDKTHEVVGTNFNYQKDISDENKEPFQHYLSRYIFPTIYFRFSEDELDGKRVVVLFIPAARIVPTSYKGIRFIRIGSSKEKLSKYPDREAALFYILHQLQNPTDEWEIRKSKYHIKDINRFQFDRYLKNAKEAERLPIDSDDPKVVLNFLEVAEDDVLLNAGAAIFVDSGMNELEMVHFATDERLTILDSDRKTGCILALADKAVQYVSRAINWGVVFDGSVERKEIPEIPIPAVREAIINAFAHRVIESRQPVDVSVYKSYIDIYSPGLFPEGVEPEEFIHEMIKPHRRNPLITQTLYYSKDTESFATGIKLINAACNDAGVKYEFIRETFGFTVRFYRPAEEEWARSILLNQPLTSQESKQIPESAEGPAEGPAKGPESAEGPAEGPAKGPESAEGPAEGQAKGPESAEEPAEGPAKGPESTEGPAEGQAKGPESAEGPAEGPAKGPESKITDLDERCTIILRMINENPNISRSLISRELHLTQKQVRTAMDRLKADGKIHYERKGKNGMWIID